MKETSAGYLTWSCDYRPRPPGAGVETTWRTPLPDGALDGWALDRFRAGARHATLHETVDLTGASAPATALRRLAVVRELTGMGIPVDWSVRLRTADDWRRLGHLTPPRHLRLPGDPEEGAGYALRAWRAAHLPGMCIWRKGPGFVEIRDHRGDPARVELLDGPAALSAQSMAADGATDHALPADLSADWLRRDLLLAVGPQVLWLPCRPHRWPFPAMLF
ncbi:DUF5825 family protein [Streptomyces sp. NPDC017993]|uniref:DUF5825 family protein n=1 Tax=Streptomyces sp. NPDC017993 TaxID=3365027 RepID=UPI0037955A8A